MRNYACRVRLGLRKKRDDRAIREYAHAVAEPELCAHEFGCRGDFTRGWYITGHPLGHDAEDDERASVAIRANDLLFESVKDLLEIEDTRSGWGRSVASLFVLSAS